MNPTEKGRRGFFASLLGGARELVAGFGDTGPDRSDGPDGLAGPGLANEADGPRFTFESLPASPAPAVPRAAPTKRLVRPPGALPEAAFATACTRCGACIEACPEATLAIGSDGFPVAETWRSACALCPKTPCIAACEPQALIPTPPAQFRLGVVFVMERLCLNFGHTPKSPDDDDEVCDRCLDWCPIPHALVAEDSVVPKVDPEHCTGCGLCVAHCAALPRAITFKA